MAYDLVLLKTIFYSPVFAGYQHRSCMFYERRASVARGRLTEEGERIDMDHSFIDLTIWALKIR